MVWAKDKLVAQLNRLTEVCIDAEEGYQQAAEQIEDFELTALLADCARGRTAMADELQNMVQALGGDPVIRGTASGRLRRKWLRVKKTLAKQSNVSILCDCRQGEEVVAEEFRRALEQPLPAEQDAVVRRQFSTIVATCERLKSLEQSLKSKSVDR